MRVILLGYNENLGGGVVVVTSTLMQSYRDIKLLPIVNSYSSRVKEFALYCRSILLLLLNLRRKTKIQIIIGSKGDLLRAFIPVLICRATKNEIIFHYHKSVDILAPRHGTKLFEKITSRLHYFYAKANKHVYLSQGLLEQAHRYTNVNADRRVIPNILDDFWFASENTKEKDIDVCFIGRWSKEKGVDDLLKVVSKLAHINFHVISNVPSDVHLPVNIISHSWGERTKIKNIMCRSKVLFLPSYAEAYPTVIIEALSCATTFVASDLIGIKDIAKFSSAGLTAQPGDIDRFVELITFITSNEEARNRMSHSGLKWVSKTHIRKNIEVLWHKLYSD